MARVLGMGGGSSPNLTNGAAHVSLGGAPAAQITPQVSGTPQPFMFMQADTNASTMAYVRITVNPGDDFTGATRLKAFYPEVLMLGINETVTIYSPTIITDVYAVGCASIAEATTNPTILDTTTSADGSSYAATLAALTHFTFDSTDAVNTIECTVSERGHGAATTYGLTRAQFLMVGYSK